MAQEGPERPDPTQDNPEPSAALTIELRPDMIGFRKALAEELRLMADEIDPD